MSLIKFNNYLPNMYNLRPRNKSDNVRKYYFEDDEDSFTPKKNKKKAKNKTKAKTKNKRSNKNSLNIKRRKTEFNIYQKSNAFFPIRSFVSEIQSQIDYPKAKSKKYYENKSKEKINIPPYKKDNKSKKDSNTNFRKEYEIKTEKYINIKKEELKEYDYIKDIDEIKKRNNTIHVYQNDKIAKGKVKKEQNKKSTKRGNTIIYEKTKESIPKKKNNKKRNSKNERTLNKSLDCDKIYNKYKRKNYPSYDFKRETKKSNINNDRKNNNNYKYGSSYNKYKFKVILDESDEEKDICDIDEKPKTINKKNVRLEKEKNNKYGKDKKVEKAIKNKTKIKKEENNNNLIKVHNNIVDINKSLLNDSFDLNQYILPQLYSNQNNYINKKKVLETCTLKAKNTNFGDKLFKYNYDDLEKYKYSTCLIDDELFTITVNRFPKSNDIETKIKLEENEEDEDNNNINLLGNKRKRNIKKEKVEYKKSNKKAKKRNQKENKTKEEKIKKEKQRDKEMQKTKNKKNKRIKNENQKIKKTKTSNIKVTQLKKEEYYEDDYKNEYDYDDDIINNNSNNIKSKSKRGTKKHRSMKKKEKVKVKKVDIKIKKEKESHEDDYMVNSCSSLSDGEKNMQKFSINDSKNTMKYAKCKNQSIIIIKSEENSDNPETETEKYEKMEGEDSPIFSLYKNTVEGDIENKEIKENNISYDNYNDITINKNIISDFSNKQYSYSSFENSFDYSFPIEYEDKIQIKEDVTYFGRNTRYIKYNPIDEFATPIPIKDKKNFKNKIAKPKYINFLNKSKKDYNTFDSDLTDITSSNNNNDGNDNELPAILCIPRIKPFKDEYSKKIINKLKNSKIPQHKILDEKVKKEEQKFMRSKNLGIIEFQEDNDIDTDEEQLQLEIERNNEALINFMKKIENDREYVENNLTRKKRE